MREARFGCMVLPKIILTCALTFFALILSASAQESRSASAVWNKIAGNWNISYEDQKLGTVKGSVTISEGGMTGVIFYPKGLTKFKEQENFSGKLKFDGTTVEANFWPYFENVRTNLTLSADGNTLLGTWSERNQGWREGNKKYDKPESTTGSYTATGKEVWKRAIPKIERVTVTPSGKDAIDYKGMPVLGTVPNGNLPLVRLTIEGYNLPTHWQSYLNVKFDDRNLIHPNRVGDTTKWWQEGQKSTLQLAFHVGKTKPGPKTMFLNGVKTTWSLPLKNHDSATGAQLRFVRRATTGFVPLTGLRYDQPFYIEALFKTAPAATQQTVMLEWGEGGSRSVPVKKDGKNPKLFRSAALRMKRPNSIGTPSPVQP